MFGIGGSRRDEELYVTLLKWLGQIMMNFTVGLVSALISFGFSLVSMIWEYKVRRHCHCAPPPPPSGLHVLLARARLGACSARRRALPEPHKPQSPRPVAQASYLSGFIFFFVAFSGASAMVATFVGGMYATAAGGVYTLIQAGAKQQRLQGQRAREQQRMRYARQGHYEHYD
jgi:hypothetical protein